MEAEGIEPTHAGHDRACPRAHSEKGTGYFLSRPPQSSPFVQLEGVPLDIEVRLSKTHGFGVFALRDFKPGEVVIAWNTSVRLSHEQAEYVADAEKVYLHPYDAHSYVLVQPPERYVNHSCAHNTEVIDFCDIAVRQISIGEEILSNYETDGAGLSFMCNCGSLHCRGAIGAKKTSEISP